MGIDLREAFQSHPGKFLQYHLEGVAAGVRKRTEALPQYFCWKAAEIAALFHDLGKINPNFQLKLKGETDVGYSSHAYLSAFAWMCFCDANRDVVKDWLGTKERILSVAAMVARHHGNLPNFEDGIFNERPANDLKKFLASHADLPISEFLQIISNHKPFSLSCSAMKQEHYLGLKLLARNISDRLVFFLETQFGFACLIESDKRDASDNKEYNKEKLGNYFRENFAALIEEKLQSFTVRNSLDTIRTQMREDVVKNLIPKLDEGKRIFSLSAPTGAGKTLMLLSLAAEIQGRNPELSVVYALPFLSITEQVEAVCKEIFYDNDRAVLRIDSKSENKRIEELQQQLDDEPSKITELLRENFSEHTFDHPFIVTTFVQLFETLVSNRNSTLLRLPNFSRTIFLLDEIQSLPPRLYTFFAALLDEFCRQFDSYAIISTATMPYLLMPEKDFLPQDEQPNKLFKKYSKPDELLDGSSYYQEREFNRYRITRLEHGDFQIENLADEILSRNDSCLIILNTINDTRQLYDQLCLEFGDDECVLLNTHFTLNDRRGKLSDCKERLDKKEKVVLISTQLIEAGVDIDFPILYRDLCPLPNLIQSAGRCNRNGRLPIGEVFLFELRKSNGLLSASLIYRDEALDFLRFCKQSINGTVTEVEMLEIQKRFFQYVANNLTFGLHKQSGGEINMVKCINQARFEELGKFRLIDPELYGIEFKYYIPVDSEDIEFEKLKDLASFDRSRRGDFSQAKLRQLEIERQLRKMSGNIVTFRLPVEQQFNAPQYEDDEVIGIRKLAQQEDYSSKTGIKLDNIGGCII